MAEKKRLTKWQGEPNRTQLAATVGAWLAAALLAAALLTGCATTTEEHISASADSIVFSRIVGRKAATGGFMLSKDSLVMRETK